MAKQITGICGNAASGKDTVCSLLGTFDLVIDADRLGHVVRERKGAEIAQVFGTADRKVLSDIVFSDPSARTRLDAIIHPALSALIRRLVLDTTAERVAVNCALLFKFRLEAFCTDIIGVWASDKVRKERLVNYRGISAEKADGIIASQEPLEKFKTRITHWLENDGMRDALEAKVRVLSAALFK